MMSLTLLWLRHCVLIRIIATSAELVTTIHRIFISGIPPHDKILSTVQPLPPPKKKKKTAKKAHEKRENLLTSGLGAFKFGYNLASPDLSPVPVLPMSGNNTPAILSLRDANVTEDGM